VLVSGWCLHGAETADAQILPVAYGARSPLTGPRAWFVRVVWNVRSGGEAEMLRPSRGVSGVWSVRSGWRLSRECFCHP